MGFNMTVNFTYPEDARKEMQPVDITNLIKMRSVIRL